jgi:uncharacterized protein YkwD
MGNPAMRVTSLRALLLALCLGGCAEERLTASRLDPNAERAAAAVHLDPQAALAQLNAYRASKGLSPVRLDPSLDVLARHQADAMAASGRLSHNVGGAFMTRLASDHIDAGEAGENLGAGYYSLDDAMAGWKGSAEHNANMLRPGFTRIGVAIAKNARTSYGVYWSMEFAGEPAPKGQAGLVAPL